MRILIAFLLFITPAMAAECPVPYSEFEANIPHVDLIECPKTIPIASWAFAAS